MKTRHIRYAAVLACMLTMPAVHAATIYSQTPATNLEITSDVDGFFRADDLSLGGADTVRSVHWRGDYGINDSPQAVDVFTINFYSDSSGPDSLLQSFAVGNAVMRTDTGAASSAGNDLYEYTADLGTGIALTGSTTYWISIFNDTTADTNDDWRWSALVGAGNGQISLDLTDWFLDDNLARYYFTLDNSNVVVPLPAAAYLFSSGLLAMLGWMRRSAKV